MNDRDPREVFGARTKAEAERTAHHLVHTLIQDYFNAGGPYARASVLGVPSRDANRLAAALKQIAAQHAEVFNKIPLPKDKR